MNHHTSRGTRTVLRLPSRKQLQAFVRDQVVPQLRDQMRAGEKLLHITINDDEVGLEITVDPARSPYSQGSFAAYDLRRIKDRNPRYSALKAKTSQLRGADGLIGVIVEDGDCAALTERLNSWDGVSAAAIAKEFLRQYSSIDFVLLLTIREAPQGWSRAAGEPVFEPDVARAMAALRQSNQPRGLLPLGRPAHPPASPAAA